jgi:hypothetical protein
MKRLFFVLVIFLFATSVSVGSPRPASALETADAFLQQSASSSRGQLRLAALALQNSSDARVQSLAELLLT